MSNNGNKTADVIATGKCLCGQLKYRARNMEAMHICHCRNCAHWNGGPAFSVRFKDGYDIEGPVKWFSASEWADRGFCSNCGSTIFYRLKAGGWTSVTAGTLDDQSLVKEIEQHIFVDTKPGYYEFADPAPRLTQEQFMAKISAAQK